MTKKDFIARMVLKVYEVSYNLATDKVRLASAQSAGALVQLSLGAPGMVIDGGRTPPPTAFLGGEVIDLAAAYGKSRPAA